MKGFHIENVDAGVIGEVVIPRTAAGAANSYLEYLAARKKLAEELEEVEGPTSSRGGNMLEDVLQEVSHDLNMSSDWLTEWDITGLTTQGHEGISDDDQGCASPKSCDNCHPPHADRRPPTANHRY